MKSRLRFRNLRSRVRLLVDEVRHRFRQENDLARFRFQSSRAVLSSLENRLLMSASPMAVVAEVAALVPEQPTTAFSATVSAESGDVVAQESATAGLNTEGEDVLFSVSTTQGADPGSDVLQSVELVVMDSRVEDYSELLDHLVQDSQRPLSVLVLDAGTDGISQITEVLARLGNVSAIHLISHGEGGAIQLGATTLTTETLSDHENGLLAWQQFLTSNADLLIYGCDVGAGVAGQDLLSAISQLTGADLAASDDLTGAGVLGGDWDLEIQTGIIETSSAVTSSGQQQWLHLLDLVPTAQFQVNSTTSNQQSTESESRGSQNAVAMDDSGSYVVTWSSRNQDGGTWGVYARRFDSNGNALTGEILVNQTTSNEQRWSRVATDASGNFVVTWTSKGQDSGGTQGVYARRFSAAGTALSNEFRVNTTTSGDQLDSVVSMNRTGQFIVAWQGNGSGDSEGIFFRRYAANGTALDATERLANTTDHGTERDPAVAIDASGNSVVVWEAGNFLYFQRFDSSGAAAGTATQIDNVLSTSVGPSVAMDGSGNFTVVYREENLLPGVWGKGFNANGTVRYTWFQADSGSSASPSIAMAADGQYIVTWQETGDGDSTGVYARRYDADGSVSGSAFLVNQFTTGTQSNASAAMSSGIDYIVVWSGEGTGDNDGVFARQYGNAIPTISAIADQSVAEDTPTAALGFTVGDLETAAGSLIVTGATSNSSLVSVSGIVISGTGAARTVTVTPNANQFGTATITLTVNDGAKTAVETFVVTVTPVNDLPVATGESYSLAEDTLLNPPAITGLLANDTDVEGNTLTVLDFTRPANGTLSVNSSGSFVYTPNTSFNGSDAFEYLVSDGNAGRTHYWKLDANAADSVGSSSGTVNNGTATTTGRYGQALQFDGVNDNVQIPDFSYTNSFTVSFWFKVPGNAGTGYQYMYSHGTVAASNSLNVFLIESSTPAVTANDVLRTRLRDTNDADDVSGLDVDVNALGLIDNNWHQYTLTVNAGTGSTVYIDGVQRASSSSGGDSINPSGNLYLGSRNDLQADRYLAGSLDTVQVFSRSLSAAEADDLFDGGTYTATASLTVTPVNDAPVIAVNSTGSAAEGGLLTISPTILRASDVDNTPSQLTFTLTSGPSQGTVRLAGTALSAGSVWTQDDIDNNRLTYEHNGSETSADQIRFSLSDGSGGLISTTSFNFSISRINDAPVLTPASPSLGTILSSQTSTARTVSTMLGTSVTDADAAALSGIAVTATTGSGTWQYSLNGSTWLNVGSTSVSQALLLRSTDRIRYTAGAAAETASLTWYAWDQTGGTTGQQGTKFNTTTTGTGSISPFSTAQDTASLVVTVPNLPPAGVADAYILAEDSSLTTTTFSGWYNSQWTARQQLTLNNASGPVLNDTAVLVTLSGATVDYSRTQNAGQDLRFVDRDGTLLSYEIEEWNESGTSRVWVRVPQIDAASTADYIWMYYGNSSATAGQNAAAVWSGQADVVLHMTGTVTDSSPNANPVTVSGATSAAGFVSGARLFDGVDDEISLGSDDDIDGLFSGGGTVSAWINPSGWGEGGYGRIASKASSTFSGGSLGNGWAIELDAATGAILVEHGFSTSTGQWRTGAGTVSLNSWQMVTVVYNSDSTANNARVFINGVEVAVTEIRTPGGTLNSDAALALKVGNHSAASSRTFDGRIDEFRAWDSVQSADQILADYRSATGSLVSVGTVQNGPGGVLTNDTDAEGDPLTSTVVAGPAHAQNFILNSDGSFTYTPLANYSGPDSFTYRVADGTNISAPVSVTLTVQAVNDAPVITSSGGGSTGVVNVSENTTLVTTVASSDVDGGSAVYSIVGGADQSLFTIVSGSGQLSFSSSRNYEQPTDVNSDNVYEVTVQVSDGNGGVDTQTLNVTVLNVNESPVITSNGGGSTASLSIAENTTLVSTVTSSDVDGGTAVYSISGGSDSSRFVIDSVTGVLSFSSSPNFEIPTDSNGNNVYVVTVFVSDGNGGSDTQTLNVTVTNVNESPVITSSGGGSTGVVNVSENTTLVTTVASSDVDGGSAVYSIVGGADQSLFTIVSGSGQLSFSSSRNYEQPTDVNLDNVYEVIVQVSDGNGGVDTQTLNVTVLNVNEAPVITSDGGGSTASLSIAENTTLVSTVTSSDVDGGTAVYSISGGSDSSRFVIDSVTGVLSFSSSPNFEIPTDSNGNNVYVVTVFVSDGNGGSDTQTLNVTVTNVNESPVITSSGGGSTGVVNVSENTTLVTTVASSDVDGGSAVYSIVGGADQSLFTIVSGSGQLSFSSSRNYEQPTDVNLDNVYEVTVQVSDGNGGVDTQTLNVTVLNVNEAPIVGAIADVFIVEDSAGQTLPMAGAFSDPDIPDSLTYSVRVVSGGSTFFQTLTINAQAGSLAYALGANINGTAVVEVRATDAGGLFVTRQFSFVVSPVDDLPVASTLTFSGVAGNTLIVPAPGLSNGVLEVDGDTLTFTIVTPPQHGIVVLTSGGGFEYIPEYGYSGPDSFEFAAFDGITVSNDALAQVQIVTGSGQPNSTTTSSSSSSGSGSSSTAAASAGTTGAGTSGTASATTNSAPQNAASGPPVGNGSGAGTETMVSSGTEDEDEQNPASGALSGLLQDEKSGTLNISVFHTSTSLVKLNAVNALREMTALEAGSSDSSVPGTVSLNVTPEMMLATRQQWFAHNSVRFSQLDSFEEDVSRHVGFDSQLVGSVGAVTTGLSVGYIIWVVRGGMLLSGLLAQMPAWQMLDPLLVIDGPGRDREDDGETIYSIVENQERLPEQVAETADSVSPEKCLTAVGAKG